ncbi:hypothetical protein HDU83_009885 [Entophlyctis luteolus]|nr:hypothetical protein HDU83_009885 [Entophlyctis luteolus]
MLLDSMRIAFVGGGNMARAMIGGLLAAGLSPERVFVAEPFEPTREGLRRDFPAIRLATDSLQAAEFAPTVIVLATKPQVLKAVAESLRPVILAAVKANPAVVVVSIAAGVRTVDLARWLDFSCIVRVMPNTPALVSEGAAGLFAHASVSEDLRSLAFEVCRSFSKVLYWVKSEQLLDVVTGVSGSGPAYFFYMIEAMEEAGVELGLPREIARGLAAQTCLGAGKMALEQISTEPATLRKNVTSPNGTTEAGVKVLEARSAKQIIKDCVIAATKRGDELGDILGRQVFATISVSFLIKAFSRDSTTASFED